MKKSDLIQKDFSFAQGQVNVFTISVDKNRRLLPIYMECLSLDEKNKASRFKFKIDQDRFIISRGVLRILSGKFLKKGAQQIQFTYGEYEKPDYVGNQRLNFNLSHSGNLIVIGFVEDYEIGVDVEYIKTDFDLLKLGQKFFSKNEIISLEKQAQDDLPKAFFRCWTRKESFIKAEGSGLSFPLDKFSVSLESDEKAQLLETMWDLKEKDQWTLFSFKPTDEYIAAVAVKHQDVGITYTNWDSD